MKESPDTISGCKCQLFQKSGYLIRPLSTQQKGSRDKLHQDLCGLPSLLNKAQTAHIMQPHYPCSCTQHIDSQV